MKHRKTIPVIAGALIQKDVKYTLSLICERYGVNYDLTDFGGVLQHRLLLTIWGEEESVNAVEREVKKYIYGLDS